MAGGRSELRPCACALERGDDGAARQQQGGSRAASTGVQRRGERVAAVRALPRAQGGESQRGREREEREKGSGERNKSQRFD